MKYFNCCLCLVPSSLLQWEDQSLCSPAAPFFYDAKISDLPSQQRKRKGDLETLRQLIQQLTRFDLFFSIPLVNHRVASEVYKSSQGWRHGVLRIGGWKQRC